jgi:type I restriction enzyme S subunit
MSNTLWPHRRLGDVLTQVSRPVAIGPTTQYRTLGMRWYAQGLFAKEIKPGSDMRATKLYRVEQGDLVYNRLFAWKGSFALVEESNHDAFVSAEFPCFRVRKERAYPEYLVYFLSRESVWDEIQRRSTGQTNISRLRLKEPDFLAMEVPLPPVAEQRRIVGRIEEVASKIEEARRLRREAEENAEALFEQARAQAFEKAALHGVRPVSEIATLERGRFSHRPRNDTRFFGGDHPWIQITEIERSAKYIREWSETLNDAGLAISKKFPKGTVLISIAATIGAVGILDFDCCIPDSIVGLTPNEGADSEFIYHYLGYVRTHLESIAPQSAQKNINLRILAGLPVPQVTLPVQRRIVAELDTLQAEVDRLKRLQSDTAAELEALLPSVLERAFRGEL